MTALPKARLTVDEHITWAERQPGTCIARAASDTIITGIINEGSIMLDPPRIEILMTDVYAA
jgi:hypothetical protein